MTRRLPLLLCVCLLLPSLARAEEPPAHEQELAMLRHSGSYQEGLELVREKIEFAYDAGAVNGASQWATIHSYYIELARAMGCAQGAPYEKGPLKVCHKVSRAEPMLLGAPYEKGHREVGAASLEVLYPERVKSVLLIIYDYGYVQGLKHGLRKNNDDLRWAQGFYRSCVERANDGVHEPVCASASKTWSEDLLKKLRAQIDAHGLPVGKEPR